MSVVSHLRTVLIVAAGCLLLTIGLVSAGAQQEPTLDLEVNSFQILREDDPTDEGVPAFVLRQGQHYRFRIHYEVEGAEAIRTSHVFAFEEVATGRRLDIDSRSFDPEPPGAYNESSSRTLGSDWPPGVYRLVWTLRATAVNARSASQDGSLVFLVAGPVGP